MLLIYQIDMIIYFHVSLFRTASFVIIRRVDRAKLKCNVNLSCTLFQYGENAEAMWLASIPGDDGTHGSAVYYLGIGKFQYLTFVLFM